MYLKPGFYWYNLVTLLACNRDTALHSGQGFYLRIYGSHVAYFVHFGLRDVYYNVWFKILIAASFCTPSETLQVMRCLMMEMACRLEVLMENMNCLPKLTTLCVKKSKTWCSMVIKCLYHKHIGSITIENPHCFAAFTEFLPLYMYR